MKIYYIKMDKNYGYTSLLMKGEKPIKTLTMKKFIELADKDDVKVSRLDLITIIEEMFAIRNKLQEIIK